MRAALLVVLAVGVACGRVDFNPRAGAEDGGTPGADADGGGSGSGVTAAWSLVQVQGTDGGALPVTATRAGDLIVVALQSGLGTDTATAMLDNAPGGTSVYVSLGSAARCVDTETDVGVEIWYTAASQPGATTISAFGPVGAAVAWEVATTGLATVDAVGHDDDQPSTAAPSASIATTQPGDFLIAAMRSGNEITGTAAGGEFVEDEAINNDGWAHLADPAAAAGAYQAVWIEGMPAGFCASVAAFTTR